jgi:exodeoxyribonuclease VII large subunit
VGHEIDYTIADFVADLRAPTPSAAAEMAIPAFIDLQTSILAYEERLIQKVNNIITQKRHSVKDFLLDKTLSRTSWRIEQSKQDLDILSMRLQEGMTGFVSKKDGILKLLSAKLDLLNPLNILGRGYTLAYNSEGEVLSSVNQVRIGDKLSLRLRDGVVDCNVRKVSISENDNGEKR